MQQFVTEGLSLVLNVFSSRNKGIFIYHSYYVCPLDSLISAAEPSSTCSTLIIIYGRGDHPVHVTSSKLLHICSLLIWFQRKLHFNLEILQTLGQDQGLSLTFYTMWLHLGIAWMLPQTLKSLVARVSEKCIVFTFPHRKDQVTKFDLTIKKGQEQPWVIIFLNYIRP